jgi:tryptophan synthase beta subunit
VSCRDTDAASNYFGVFTWSMFPEDDMDTMEELVTDFADLSNDEEFISYHENTDPEIDR